MAATVHHPPVKTTGISPPLPVPSPEQRAALSAFAGHLFDLYGGDRSTWPHPDAWPWDALESPRAA